MGYQGFPIGKRHNPLFPPGSSNRDLIEDATQTPFFEKVAMREIWAPRLLFIDAYDSFSNNIIALLHESLTTAEQQPTIEKITIDQAPYWPLDDGSRASFIEFLSNFDAVIAGPGPGDPANAKDVGLFRCLWSLPEEHRLPVLGICLGFQSMCLDAGASVNRLALGRHGIVTDVDHCNKSIFANIGRLEATHYHSLHVNIDHPLQTGIGFYSSAQMWNPSLGLPRIIPLAWDCNQPFAQSHWNPEMKQKLHYNGAILMAARIDGMPWWGVQYHPESICSGKEEATLLIKNWWKEAKAWLKPDSEPETSKLAHFTLPDTRPVAKRRSSDTPDPVRPAKKSQIASNTKGGFSSHTADTAHSKSIYRNRRYFTEADSDSDEDQSDNDDDTGADIDDMGTATVARVVPAWFGGFCYSSKVTYEKVFVPIAARPRVLQHVRDILQTGNRACSVLESGQNGTRRSTGRFSIVGIVDSTSLMIGYSRATRTVRIFRHDDPVPVFEAAGVDFESYWLSLKKHFHAEGGHRMCPFWGGSILCIGYEACLDTIRASHGKSYFSNDDRPDIFGSIVMRSAVIDHHYYDVWVQSIVPDDKAWVRKAQMGLINAFKDQQKLISKLQNREQKDKSMLETEAEIVIGLRHPVGSAPALGAAVRELPCTYAGPSKAAYEAKVRQCQECIAAGDSYELCLTGQTTVHMPLTKTPRLRDDLLYRNFTIYNPAPFGARIQLTIGQIGVTVFSGSPERFLRWDRRKKCEFRPIKGTLAKTPGMTKEDAEEYFKSTKERAENLMITDLIRHDLYGVLQQPDSVKVSPEKLFHVEEYSTVFQLVTAIEGRFRNSGKTGNDVLNASLPPGSMTGAPKRRSCELLQEIEDFQPRGLYSGVLGYDDVGGGGDFSVLIRAAVLWDQDIVSEKDRDGNVQRFEKWTIGAGGAVTALSNPTDEYDEMITKRSAVLQAFKALPGHVFSES